MPRVLTFVPVTPAEALALGREGTEPACPRPAFAVTPELVAALGYTPDQGEDAEYAALVLASVWSLAHAGVRLVLVAELAPDLVSEPDDADADNGEVRVSGVPRGSVVAWFGDEPQAAALVAAAASAAKGHDIDTAWEQPAVQELITQHDLLWHAADELAHVNEEN